MEEIDIIELLQRVKEGNTPKKIEINDTVYEYIDDWGEIQEMYQQDNCQWLYDETIVFDTKIKILDKPIIEELKLHPDEIQNSTERKMEIKINEIIRYINGKENKNE